MMIYLRSPITNKGYLEVLVIQKDWIKSEDYDFLQEKLFALCQRNGMPSLIQSWHGHIFPSRAYEEGGIHEAIADYEDAVFFNILAEELARRDLGLENSDPEDFTELQARMEEYMAEFEKNGLNTISIDI